MDTIKTAAVVALLLAVLYGIYVVLNHEEPAPPPELGQIALDDSLLQPPSVESGRTVPEASVPAASRRSDGSSSASPTVDNQPRIFVQVEPPSGPTTPAPELPPTAATVAATAPPRTQPVVAGDDHHIRPPPTKLPPIEDTSGGPTAGGSFREPAPGTAPGRPSDTAPDTPFSDAGGARRVDANAGTDPSSAATTTWPASPDRMRPADGQRSSSGWSSTGPVHGSLQPRFSDSVGTSASADNSSAAAPSPSSSVYSTPSSADPAERDTHDRSDPQAVASQVDRGKQRGGTSPTPSLAEAIREARAFIESRNYRDALATLSAAYTAHQATADVGDRQAALDLLDPLAAAVIYSPYHLLEPAHKVKLGESLQDIAAAYQVPWQLLRNINGIRDPESLVPGTELKVVRGPFRAVIELSASELTLYLNDFYAGRFPITTGTDPFPQPGEYFVVNKQEGRTYFAADGRTIPPHDPQNPYGMVWIDLGANGVCIHGTPRAGGPGVSAGCISLSPKDAVDVMDILSVGSRVTIRP